jgi:3-phenylpropionate/cinnamic acid dioxygenase small subunit
MTTGRPDQKGEELINVNNTVILTNLPIGQQMKLRDGSTAEVTANPRDGGWVRARFIESAVDPALVGNEEMVFATDVVGLIESPDTTPFEAVDTGPERAAGLARPVTITTPEQTLERLLFEREIERFLYREAELLDDRRFNDWIELVAEDIHYHMPVRRNVKFGEQHRENTDPESEISWFDEGKRTLAGRVRQINTGLHWAEEPFSRVRHVISNIQVGEEQGGEVPVRSNFFVWSNRLHDEVNVFVGARHDVLRRDPDTGWKIARRLILLDQNVLLSKVITTFF